MTFTFSVGIDPQDRCSTAINPWSHPSKVASYIVYHTGFRTVLSLGLLDSYCCRRTPPMVIDYSSFKSIEGYMLATCSSKSGWPSHPGHLSRVISQTHVSLSLQTGLELVSKLRCELDISIEDDLDWNTMQSNNLLNEEMGYVFYACHCFCS